MKKYLIKGLLALVVGGFTASCADKDGDYVPVGQQKATAYADAFKELIGGEVAPNHDWGFTKTSIVSETSQARANTRGSEPNQTVWPDYGWPTKPGELKKTTPSGKSEEQIVTEWFQNHTIADAVTLDCNNYWVLQVHYKDYNYTANQHEWEKYENGQEVWKTGTQTVNPKGHMDQIYANKDANSTSYDHIYNFNTGSGNFMLVINSETKYGFGYEESWGTSDKHVYNRSFMAHIVDEANGIDGYYVGFDYQAYKKSNPSYTNKNGETITYYDNKDWAYEPDGIYDDRIIKIVPGTAAHEITPGGSSSSSTTTTRTDSIELRRIVAQGRVFCEDLGTSAERMTKSDIDFNDAVFDAKIWRLSKKTVNYTNNVESGRSGELENAYPGGLENGKYKYIAEIRLLAAGGTVPLKIGGNNGFEIHAKFGEGNNKTIGHTTIINTMGAPSQANFSTTVSTETCDAVTVEVDITSLVAGKTEIGLDIIPIDVLWVGETGGESVKELSADFGKAPQKLCVPIGTPWVYERIPITDAYADFASYAKSREPKFWEGSTNREVSLLYPSIPGMTAEADADVTNNINNNKCYEKTISKGQTTTTQVDNIDLWLGTKEFDNATQLSNVQLYSKDIVANDVLRVYGSNGNADNHYLQIALIENSEDWKWTDDLYNGNVDFSNGHIDIPVNTNIKDRSDIRDYLGINGQNITITRIERIRTTISHN